MKKTLLSTLIFCGMLSVAAPPSPAAENIAAAPPSINTVLEANEKSAATTKDEMQISMRVPLFSKLFASFPVATVNDDPITFEELTKGLATVHESNEGNKPTGKSSLQTVLDRLINSKLIVLEAENIGLEDLPELQKSLADYKATAPRERLKKLQLKDIKPDEAVIEKFYKAAVKEWKIRSIKLKKEEDAKELAAALKGGGDFNEFTGKLIDAGKAEGSKEAEYVRGKDLLPQIATFVSEAKIGAISPVIPIVNGFTLLKVEDIRYPENDMAALDAARQQALEQKKTETLQKFMQKVMKKYVKMNEKKINNLNLNTTEAGFNKLTKDKSILVEIKGDKPIRVKDLVEAVSQKFYHGIGEALKLKKVNEQKFPVLQEMLYKKIYTLEAINQGIDKTEDYHKAVKNFKNSMLFTAFVQKVIAPDIKVSEEDLQTYFSNHIAEYSSPEMMRIRGLAFTKKDAAESAIDKLRNQAEFQWVKTNAEDQAPIDKEGLLVFDGTLLSTRTLPDKIKESVVEAKPGDYRLADTADGFFYVLHVQDIIPAKPQAMEGIKSTIEKNVFSEKLNAALENWTTKLREAYTVKTFIAVDKVL